tara:strand:+ start:435 stop:812 length:378 start_codon:yes stop_codon:yes gene_type:complete
MQITLTLQNPLNVSLSVGDTVWYTSLTQAGGYEISDKDTILKLGTIESINRETKTIQVSRPHDPNDPNYTGPPSIPSNHYLMFSKPNSFNTSSLKGYYAQVRLDNNSTKKVELFAIGSEITESSK